MRPLLVLVGRRIVSFISWGGYPGVFMLMLIESACIPLPSEIIMPFSGYLALTGRFSLWGAVLSGAGGNLAGSVLVYWIAGTRVRGWFERATPHHADRAQKFFDRYGALSVFIGRVLPVVRTFISLPAGTLRVPFAAFCVWTFVGSLPWCFGLAYTGKILGKNWNALEPVFHRIDFPLFVLLAAGITVWYWRNKVSS